VPHRAPGKRNSRARHPDLSVSRTHLHSWSAAATNEIQPVIAIEMIKPTLRGSWDYQNK
jgi:hypothetical protein